MQATSERNSSCKVICKMTQLEDVQIENAFSSILRDKERRREREKGTGDPAIHPRTDSALLLFALN